jgi:hypothetical protein
MTERPERGFHGPPIARIRTVLGIDVQDHRAAKDGTIGEQLSASVPSVIGGQAAA